MRLRVVTYNVRGFRNGLDGITESLERLAPDLLLLQESGPRHKLKLLARAAGMDAAADPLSPFGRRVKNAILARPPWRIIQHRLHRFAGSARFYPRGALIAQVGRAGRRLWAVSIHLGLSPVERATQVRELTDVCAGLAGAPLVIAGDLNATPEGRAPAWLADRFTDAWAATNSGGGETFAADDPTARIDYVFASAGLVPELASVAKAPRSSDHLPIVVEFTILDPAAS